MTIHDQQNAFSYYLRNLCETYNHGLAHSLPHGGKRCVYASIISAMKAAKCCGLCSALAVDPRTGCFSAVCVWELQYDTRITRPVRCYDLLGKKQTVQQAMKKNLLSWIYAVTPHNIWGDITRTEGVNTVNIAFTGMYKFPDD